MYEAVVSKVCQISPTVKFVQMSVPSGRSFYAGQWADVFIPTVETVGGFSMVSAPFKMKEKSCVNFAVKFSEHPPAKWIHEKCTSGDRMQIRFGGDFFYRPEEDARNSSLLLIGGGVGINPLCSIATETNHFDMLWQKSSRVICILSSASTSNELLFKEKFLKMQSKNANLRCKFFVTKELVEENPPINGTINGRRISLEDIKGEVEYLQSRNNSVQAFICGPPQMISFVENCLKDVGMESEFIHFETWW